LWMTACLEFSINCVCDVSFLWFVYWLQRSSTQLFQVQDGESLAQVTSTMCIPE
jgi:hypothetical protein